MKRIYFLAIIFFFSSTHTIGALEIMKEELESDVQKKIVKTSLIIPCCPKHVQHLHSLLRAYEGQTVLPDEVIISLSESEKAKPEIVREVQDEKWMFPVKLIVSTKKQYAGENRNIACSRASGNVFITQDADDLPHPQRVEIIKYFFSNYKVDHLMHRWVGLGNAALPFKLHTIKQVPFTFCKNFQETWSIGMVTNGNVAISSELFKVVKWSHDARGQDVKFNQAAYGRFKNLLVVKVPLLIYRAYLSSNREMEEYLDSMKSNSKRNELRKIHPVEIVYSE